MKIDELIKEIQDLKEKERQLEYLKKDKKKMADKLLEYELKEYENTSIEERKAKYFKETCRCCRFHCENSNGLPDDIGKPIKSEVDFFPSHKGCKELAIETILKENTRLKDKIKDLEEWLEAMASMYENEYKDVNASEHYKCMLHKLKEN